MCTHFVRHMLSILSHCTSTPLNRGATLKSIFAPEVRDLSASGFPLAVGRLDYLDGKTVVALVYKRNKHPINLFITPARTSRNTSPTVVTRRGYNVLSWTNNGMDYWTVSDLNEAELREFTELVRAVK